MEPLKLKKGLGGEYNRRITIIQSISLTDFRERTHNNHIKALDVLMEAGGREDVGMLVNRSFNCVTVKLVPSVYTAVQWWVYKHTSTS
jgi:hypothetical protein